MSLKTYIGGEGNLLFELPDQAQMLELPHPILTNEDLAKLPAREHHASAQAADLADALPRVATAARA